MNLRSFSLLLLLIITLLSSCISAVDEDGDGAAGCPEILGFPMGALINCEANDRDASVHPGATEICDGIDNDADGQVDEGYDADQDGHFDASVSGCALFYDELADCDDQDPANFPGNPEICDGADNDCDASTEAGAGESDQDADGFRVCADDCNDLDATVHPDAPELCDGVNDNNCDGTLDPSEEDIDLDGETGCSDCDDQDPANFNGNVEVCDGVDNDCDGLSDADDSDTDVDGDGVSACEGDCNDLDANVHPGKVEFCNNVDDNCNGATDEGFDQDSDGFTSCGGDCNDANQAFNPDAIELCDGLDNDCSGAPSSEEVDQDIDGWLSCEECDDADQDNFPGNMEVCDGVDNDCDGVLSSDEIDDDQDGVTECDGDCDDADPANFLGNTEICDGADNDCNGVLSALEIDDDQDGVTECDGDCDDANSSNFLGNTELCDGLDNDCNGEDDVLGFVGSETDDDGDTQSECDGDCDDADPSVEGLDLDSDNWTTCDDDCDDSNPEYNPGEIEFCADWQDNDCNGLTDYEDTASCVTSCGVPDMEAPAIIPDGSFEGSVMNWFQVSTGSIYDDNIDPSFSTISSVEGLQSMALLNPMLGPSTPDRIDQEMVGVEFMASPGPSVVILAGQSVGVNGINVRIRVTDTANYAVEFCNDPSIANPSWTAMSFCCTLGAVSGSYTLLLSHGHQHPASTLLIDAVEIYPLQ